MRNVVQVIVLAFLALTSSSALAQATRTWVSGVGDDANPCSRTAPCKTFAGAISKTAARGKINVLDPGGFGAVTITKSITIEADGAPAGILVSGTNGVIINAAATDMVTLRNIKIEGIGTGLNGIRILAAGTVLIDGCVIEDFADNNVIVENSGTTKVLIRNSVLRRSGNSAVEGLVRATPATGATADVTVDSSTLFASGNGIVIGGNVQFRVRDSSVTGGINDGMVLLNVTGTRSAFVDNAMISDFGGSGISSYGIGSTVRVTGSSINGNSSGLDSADGGRIISFGDNRLRDNDADGSFTGSEAKQ